MKKLFALVALLSMFTFSANNVVFADQPLDGDTTATEQVDTSSRRSGRSSSTGGTC